MDGKSDGRTRGKSWKRVARSICTVGKGQVKARGNVKNPFSNFSIFETYFRPIMTITLHLKTLAQVHQAFVNLASLSKSGSSCSGIPGALRSYMQKLAVRSSYGVNILSLYSPAKSTTVSCAPLHEVDIPPLGRLFTSTQKKPWLRELTLLLPVPATLRSIRPVSKTISASS